MNVTVTIQFDSIAAAVAALREIPEASVVGQPSISEMSAALQAKNAVQKAQTAETKEAPGKSSAQTARSEPTAQAVVAAAPAKTADASAQPAVSAAAAPQASTAANEPTFDELKKEFLALSNTPGGRDKCQAVLKSAGVPKLSELKPEQYAVALGEIKKLAA